MIENVHRLPFQTAPFPERRPIQGWILTGLGWFIVGFPMSIMSLGLIAAGILGLITEIGALSLPAEDADVFLAYVAGPILSAIPILFLSPLVPTLLRRGRQLRAIGAMDLLTSDRRAPVLFLRSFDDDDLNDPTPSLFFALGPQRYETRLVRALSEIGPSVAIGRPGESRPELGAARLYVHDDEWQIAVRHFLSLSAVVLVVIGRSEGVWWEVFEAIKTVESSRLLFFFPYVASKRSRSSRLRRLWLLLRGTAATWGQRKTMEREREERYVMFRRETSNHFRHTLPGSLGRAQFLTFSADGKPQLLESRRRRWIVMLRSMSDRTTRTHINIKSSLKPFVESRRRAGAPVHAGD